MSRRDSQRAARAALALLCVVAALSLSFVSTRASTATAVRVLPAGGAYELGREIPAQLWIEDVAGLYGAEIRLSFDAQQLQVVDANLSRPGIQLGISSDLLSPDFVIRNEADNLVGTAWYAVTQLNPSPPVTGSGALFNITFVAVGLGGATVEVIRQVLGDIDANVLPAAIYGAGYQVEGTARVFLPLVNRQHGP